MESHQKGRDFDANVEGLRTYADLAGRGQFAASNQHGADLAAAIASMNANLPRSNQIYHNSRADASLPVCLVNDTMQTQESFRELQSLLRLQLQASGSFPDSITSSLMRRSNVAQTPLIQTEPYFGYNTAPRTAARNLNILPSLGPRSYADELSLTLSLRELSRNNYSSVEGLERLLSNSFNQSQLPFNQPQLPSASALNVFLAGQHPSISTSRSYDYPAILDHRNVASSSMINSLPENDFALVRQYRQQLEQNQQYNDFINRTSTLAPISREQVQIPQEPTDISPFFFGTHMSPRSNFFQENNTSSDFKLNSSSQSRSVEKETSKASDISHDDVPWEDLLQGGVLTSLELRGAVSDVHFAVMAQMKPCQLTYEDRVGLYKARDIGCRGMCCKHCGGVPGFGRYFPGSLTSLINGSICKSIMKHLLEECHACPAYIRDAILKLDCSEIMVPFHYERGSRRQFFELVWNTIQEGRPKDGDTCLNQDRPILGWNGITKLDTLPSTTSGIDGNSDQNVPWSKILEDCTVVLMSDRHLVPDTIFAATAQTKPCEITDDDRVGRCKDHKVDSMGLCCKHCGGKPGAFGRYFPSNLHTFAQVEVCKQIVKHITGKCHLCPPEIRNAILHLQQMEETIPAKRYPSRMVFFRRVWHRFHYDDGIDSNDTSDDRELDKSIATHVTTASESDDIPWNELLKDTELVCMEDQGLISDSQFAAISQMVRCQLTHEDRIGYNKDRAIGFVGMACRHCGGHPGFGRYFPNTVRNFEKTSARDTIVSHVAMFCKQCPEIIRNAMLSLKRIESSRNGSATMKGLVYGSGKLFFRRVWSRLHTDGSINDLDDFNLEPKPCSSCDGHAAKSDGNLHELEESFIVDKPSSTSEEQDTLCNDSEDDPSDEESSRDANITTKKRNFAALSASIDTN
jgi:hypothetical protein